MFEVVLHRRAARYFERLDAKTREQLRARFEALGRDPLRMPGVKAMAGEWKGFHRLRHGDLRIVFAVDAGNRTVVIAHLGPRGDVYTTKTAACTTRGVNKRKRLPTSRSVGVVHGADLVVSEPETAFRSERVGEGCRPWSRTGTAAFPL